MTYFRKLWLYIQTQGLTSTQIRGLTRAQILTIVEYSGGKPCRWRIIKNKALQRKLSLERLLEYLSLRTQIQSAIDGADFNYTFLLV